MFSKVVQLSSIYKNSFWSFEVWQALSRINKLVSENKIIFQCSVVFTVALGCRVSNTSLSLGICMAWLHQGSVLSIMSMKVYIYNIRGHKRYNNRYSLYIFYNKPFKGSIFLSDTNELQELVWKTVSTRVSENKLKRLIQILTLWKQSLLKSSILTSLISGCTHVVEEVNGRYFVYCARVRWFNFPLNMHLHGPVIILYSNIVLIVFSAWIIGAKNLPLR